MILAVLVVIIMATYSLVLDFNSIQTGVKRGGASSLTERMPLVE